MTIILTGGGSGGHITPVLAVAKELKKRQPNTKIVYIGQKRDRFADIVKQNEHIDEVVLIRAGKFRRFHGEGLKQIFNLKVLVWNVRDIFYIAIGSLESLLVIRKLRPAVVFSRGGYVSVPVAVGAKFNHVPYITHDSDPIPSLANRLIAPWAKLHAVALPKEIYPYPPDKTVTTGIPLSHKFVPVTTELKNSYKKQIGIPEDALTLFVIGGGLGSLTLNNAVVSAAKALLKQFSNLHIFHVAGALNNVEVSRQYETELTEVEQGRVKIFGFIADVYKYSGAADVIVSRAGATNLAEFALQGKAVIVVPSPFLTGGHQVRNAEYLAQSEAAIKVSEDQLDSLGDDIAKLLKDKKLQKVLSQNLRRFAIANAAEIIAELTLGLGRKHEDKK